MEREAHQGFLVRAQASQVPQKAASEELWPQTLQMESERAWVQRGDPTLIQTLNSWAEKLHVTKLQ